MIQHFTSTEFGKIYNPRCGYSCIESGKFWLINCNSPAAHWFGEICFNVPRRMPTYLYVSGEKPFFSNDQQAKIGNGVVVQFLVTTVRWIKEGGMEKSKKGVFGIWYLVFGRVEGESFGPISFSGGTGTGDLDL